MLDVFDLETESVIKDGISNLYWYKGDLKKACIHAGISVQLCNEIWNKKKANNYSLTKREIMDEIYLNLRKVSENERIRISREFVRILIEQKDFTPQDIKHNIKIAELSAFKLKGLIDNQKKELEKKKVIKANYANQENYGINRTKLYNRFLEAVKLEPKKRGYELEKIFVELMKISKIEVAESFKNVGEQIDGAIKHENNHYLVELKWQKDPTQQKDLASFYFKVEGKLAGTRGIMISMNGYSKEMLESISIGKELKVMIFDGVHLMNVLSGMITFSELMNNAIRQASLNGKLYSTYQM